MDTIVAVSSPVGVGGIGVVRTSGTQALAFAGAVFNRAARSAPEPNKMYFGEFVTPDFSDKGYMVHFQAPHSFTGEDVVEYHLHGSPRILAGAVDALIALGARHAERGEFTRRAVMNGKLSVTEAEGVIDMINAESASAVRAAYSMMSGALSSRLRELSGELKSRIAELEVALDYPEETEDESFPDARLGIAHVKAGVDSLLKTARTGMTAKHGLDVAIVGRPNVGKSSLLNCIVKHERAIVSEIAGTTRDLVTESVEYRGVRLNLTDCAGLRDTTDKIEQIGVEYAKNAAKSADLVIWVEDDPAGFSSDIAKDFGEKPLLRVLNKTDLSGGKSAQNAAGTEAFFVSAKTGEGVNGLLDAVVADFESGEAQAGKYVVSNLRHVSALTQASIALASALDGFDEYSVDCVLVDLHAAFVCLGELTGDTATESILDEIFERFCVGK